MGKLGPRLCSRKKAKRWQKGQSASSNPETTKHREQATGMFFKVPIGEKLTSGLTTADLKRHDAIQGIPLQLANLDLNEDCQGSVISGTTANTSETYASNYSNCSNISFNRFLNHFQSSSLIHKEMLAVLAAVTEVIKQNGGTESSTEYFAALMSTLEAVEEETSAAAILSLLSMNLKTVPKNVMITQFDAASQLILQIFTKYSVSENYLIIRHCIISLCLLLRAQEAAAWTNSSVKQVMDVILSFCVHGKPKVRKSAQHGICAILKGSDIMKSENPPVCHPGAAQVAKHCIEQLYSTNDSGSITTILHTLTLLKDIVHQLPKSYVKTICEGLLRIMGLKNILVTSCCLQTLHGLFVSRPLEAVLPAQRNAQIITALYDYQPPANDTQPTLAWLTVMQEAHCNLANLSIHLCSTTIPKILEKCADLWLSEKREIITAASHTIKAIMEDCFAPLCKTEKLAKQYNFILDQVIAIMEKSISYQYLEAWYHVLQLTAVLFQVAGQTYHPRLIEFLKIMPNLRNVHNFAYISDVEYVIGAAIKTMGPETVLGYLPIKLDNETINLNRTWMLPLLKDCISGGSLSFFIEHLLPLSIICEEKMKNPAESKRYELCIPQIWSILPSICNNANDVKENFPSIAQMLGMIISNKEDLRVTIMASLRKLIAKAVQNDKEDDIMVLSRFAKNYLPLLFNIYTTRAIGTSDQGQRIAAYNTITIYLTITGKEMANDLFDRALEKLKEPGAEEYLKESLNDLIRALCGYTDSDRLKIFYQLCVPYLKDTKHQKDQKKSYRFLEEILSSDKDACKNYVMEHRKEIQKVIISSATTVINSSRTARLRCLMHLVKIHPQLEKTKFFEAIVPEVVLCIKNINERCRTTAYQLLNDIAHKLMKKGNYLQEFTKMLMAGFDGEPKYCSASLLALASLTYHFNGSLGVETVLEILKSACSLAKSPAREVAEAVLSYIKVFIAVMPAPIIAPTLPQLLESFSVMTDDCKRHCRQKVRDLITKFIRKYGFQTITSLVPASDVILQKRLKNINKVEEAKRKTKELKKKKDDDNEDEFDPKRRPRTMDDLVSDSDIEIDEEKEEPNKKNKRKSRKEAWIQETEENIVDLIDPAATRNITTTKPGASDKQLPVQKKNESKFKLAPDGRLIIVEDTDKDSDSEFAKKKNMLAPSDSDEDCDENVKVIVSSKPGIRKRSHSECSDNVSLISQGVAKYRAGGSGIHRPVRVTRKDSTPGSEYRAKKAAGDIKKKNKPDPYAYLPLTRSLLNKRKKQKNAGRFLQSIVAGARKGAKIGTKNKRKRLN
ncbi:RRP12-like protein [Prorops nasuta]|uniref:RRP12-like protein n=1 Tax=Prorops nasuta TaxID=863751 RepID=UPI0034CD9B72